MQVSALLRPLSHKQSRPYIVKKRTFPKPFDIETTNLSLSSSQRLLIHSLTANLGPINSLSATMSDSKIEGPNLSDQRVENIVVQKITFHLPGFTNHEIPVEMTGVDVSKAELLAFPAFQKWLNTLKASLNQQKFSDHSFHKSRYELRKIIIQSVDWFGPKEKPRAKLGFVKLKAEIENGKGETLPGVVFLRGGSVAVLMIVRPSDSRDERWVIMTEQPRIPAGSLLFMEIPAGMIDDSSRTFAGEAAREIKEEVGLTIRSDELIDMTQLAVQGHKAQESLANAMYPSPGGCDEYIAIFLWEKEMDRLQIENLKGKLTGERTEQEKITVRLLDYERLLEVGGRDAKTLAAWSLYEYLKRIREIS
jgi:ADP-sugar diphosphatase